MEPTTRVDAVTVRSADLIEITEDHSPRIPTALHHLYTIGERIGSGGMGDVFEARCLRSDTRVALKVGRSSIDRAHIANEALCLQSLSHRNIVRLLDVEIREGSDAYVALEHIEGESLQERLRRERRLSERDAIAIMLGLLDALDHVHQAGLVHCDVKPANIMLERTETGVRPVLIDFGLAIDPHSSSSIRGGTVTYMAPEQALQADSFDHRADVYSAGTVLYCMLAGRTPFIDRTALAALITSAKNPAPPISEFVTVRPRLQRIIERALAFEPSERFSSASEFRRALIALLVPARRRQEPEHQPSARDRWVVLAAACALLAFFAVLSKVLPPSLSPRVEQAAIKVSMLGPRGTS